jgi:hypothetical protein
MTKPKSMSTGQRNIVRPNDSNSLWNYTLSPGNQSLNLPQGWSQQECDIYRKALIRFGIGNWKDILESGILPVNLETFFKLSGQNQRTIKLAITAIPRPAIHC